MAHSMPISVRYFVFPNHSHADVTSHVQTDNIPPSTYRTFVTPPLMDCDN